MWAVIVTTEKGGTFEDSFAIHESLDDATKVYDEIIKDPNTFAAGVADIRAATEPQWLDNADTEHLIDTLKHTTQVLYNTIALWNESCNDPKDKISMDVVTSNGKLIKELQHAN